MGYSDVIEGPLEAICFFIPCRILVKIWDWIKHCNEVHGRDKN